MKLFVRMMMFMVVLALAGPFLLKGPNGQPLISLKDFNIPDFSLPKAPQEDLSGKEQEAWISWSKDNPQAQQPKVYIIDPKSQQPMPQRPGVYYRWKDQNGIWQFSTKPNPNTANIVVETDPNANVVQSLSNDKIDSALGRVRETAPVQGAPSAPEESSIPLPTTIPITEVPDLINQAKAVQDLVNKRTEIIEKNSF
ncbi:MAG: hypothetical protein MI867_04145 [Pseudomonadales bacterium]|nr:hypothetical protein [Pseudomonadales bacterium]